MNGNYLNKTKRGFTIVELLVVLSVIALLLSIVTPRYLNKIEAGKEIALRQNLSVIRKSIDQYYSDQGEYPDKLNQLVEKHYLRAIPLDPIAEKHEWDVVKEKQIGGIYDIKSTSQQIGSDNRVYSEW
ncbi:prepilin-type N-terminal cleavage/methylation domain-containing protein [Acinetobacter baumannii]|uniref:type II secretion system protein n=1 Tax=Acinetobacter baumannii TaxID=470 RepID=UPI000D0AF747|nr:prepilin-type N-terminal cleavage/methylation domain-containing protein [Acinetobacter baumannii]MDC4785837.1 type II secretion system GspH family protein [Acinetobacter baumannii]MDH2582849.1 prepilin-type N-terminal cleavage/methylation domain-containing protein [Acinetobacter baumannii]PSE09471.1 type II secretion system protein G [Acinetobacter baumannii]